MRVIAAIRADLETSDIGTRSRLADEIGGVPVLRRTVERAARIEGLGAVYVLCPVGQRDRCERMLAGTGAIVRGFDAPPGAGGQSPSQAGFAGGSAWRTLVQVARKWSLDGWRGGIGGACYFDEFTDIPLLDALLKQDAADAGFGVPEAVLSLPAAAPLLSVDLAQRMLAHRHAEESNARLVFTQAVPGLAGILLDTALIRELTEKTIPVGVVFSYKPDMPRKDLIFQPCCLEIPSELRFATGRLVADTGRSLERIVALTRANRNDDLAAIGRWLTDYDNTVVEPLPREVEIELTTDDPYPETLLRPRGRRVGQRGPMRPELIASIATELAEYDDSLLVLGGFGDPLRHPQFVRALDALRTVQSATSGSSGARPSDGVFGVAVRTAGVDLSDQTVDALVARRVDVLSILVDAWTADTYVRLQTPAGAPGSSPTTPDNPSTASLEAVAARLQRVAERRQAAGSVAPIVVPEFCKCRDNVDEMDAFFDGWLRRVGAASLVGYSHHGRQLEDRAVVDMRPPVRSACRRVRTRCMILADGSVVRCDQDFSGQTAIGRVGETSLRELWQSAAMEAARTAHATGAWDGLDLCAECDEWHRP